MATTIASAPAAVSTVTTERHQMMDKKHHKTSSFKAASSSLQASSVTPTLPPHRPPVGFKNDGNTCYANATIQCLFSTALSRALLDPQAPRIFRGYSSNSHLLMMDSKSKEEGDVEGESTNKNKLMAEEVPHWRQIPSKQRHHQMSEKCLWITKELTELCTEHQRRTSQQNGMVATNSSGNTISNFFSELFSIFPHSLNNTNSPSNNAPPIDPSSITRHVHKLSSCLHWGQQEDAHEFLRALISALIMDGFNRELSSLFDGLLESAVTCQTCGYASLTRDRYMDLSLEITDKKHGRVDSNNNNNSSFYNDHSNSNSGSNNNKGDGGDIKSLRQALQHFTRTELLGEDNLVTCEQCRTKRQVSKGLRLATAPSILVCHLKRFEYDLFGRARRINKHIDFPLRLDISDHMSRANKSVPPMYELVAIVVHLGRSCNFGHYVAYIRGQGAGNPGSGSAGRPWYRISDTNVQRVDAKTVLEKDAYILMYEVEGMRHHGIPSTSQIKLDLSPKVARKSVFKTFQSATSSDKQSKLKTATSEQPPEVEPLTVPKEETTNSASMSSLLSLMQLCGATEALEAFCSVNTSDTRGNITDCSTVAHEKALHFQHPTASSNNGEDQRCGVPLQTSSINNGKSPNRRHSSAPRVNIDTCKIDRSHGRTTNSEQREDYDAEWARSHNRNERNTAPAGVGNTPNLKTQGVANSGKDLLVPHEGNEIDAIPAPAGKFRKASSSSNLNERGREAARAYSGQIRSSDHRVQFGDKEGGARHPSARKGNRVTRRLRGLAAPPKQSNSRARSAVRSITRPKSRQGDSLPPMSRNAKINNKL